MTGEVRAFRKKRLSPEEGKAAAVAALSTPLERRLSQELAFHLDDPETLLPFLESIRERLEVTPSGVLDEATALYAFLERHRPNYPMDSFLLDEREYFLGETARIAATACRHLSHRDEARHWLDLSEGWFLQTENAAGNLSKVSYQRLAIRTESREFEHVLALLPQLVSCFEKLGMSEDALKSRFLEAEILKESDRLKDSVSVYSQIIEDATKSRNHKLLSLAHVNLVQIYGILGNVEKAVQEASKAEPLLNQLGNRIAAAKLHWGIGYLQRSRGDIASSIQAYRTAQANFSELGMRADVAAIHLVIADLLLDAGQDRQAEWEIRQALPIIDEYKLVPEGFAALSLLRESLRRQKIDRQALRNLHGYFEELGS